MFQHWKGNWQPYEGTRAWATEVGFRAIAVESEDALNGPPPRKDLRRAYFERDAHLAGTGPLASWTDGRPFKDHSLAELSHALHLLFVAYCQQEKSDEEIEKGCCDVFMGLRMGSPDRVHEFFQLMHCRPHEPWFASIRRALQCEVMQSRFPQLPEHGRTFWKTGLLAEFTRMLPAIDTEGLRWNGFMQDTPLRFGQLILWSAGACGQAFREQVLNDWTHLVLEQGLVVSLQRADWIHSGGRSCGRWLVDAFIWRARLAYRRSHPSWGLQVCWSVAIRSPIEARSPEQGDIGWRIKPRHWKWIVEWVLAWRADISSPLMLERAQALAHHLLEADGAAHNPFNEPVIQATVPPDPMDLDNRLSFAFKARFPADWRLSDEVYPAIFTVVAGWLRGSGRANSSSSVLTAAPWLSQLIPYRRHRMLAAIAGIKTGYQQMGGLSDDVFLGHWQLAAANGLDLSSEDFERWAQCQATPMDELLQALVYALLEGDAVPGELLEPLTHRLKALTGINGPGTGLGRGIDLDLLWGIEAALICIRQLPLSLADPLEVSEPLPF